MNIDEFGTQFMNVPVMAMTMVRAPLCWP
eukprot:COSAG02_NODE_10003_length_2053_cov_2.514841_1_plen_28_part_10